MTDLHEAHTNSRRLWESMAPAWERSRDFLRDSTAEMTDWMIEKLAPRPGEVILDVAAGAGDVGFRFASRLEPGGKLITTDFAPEMVEAARRTAAGLGITNAEIRVLDAERNDLPDASVDGAISRWGFMLMHDPAAAFRQCHRVLTDPGRLVFAVMASPADNPWGSIPVAALADLGFAPPADPNTPGGLFSLADQDRLSDMLTAAGFTRLEVARVPFHFAFESFDGYWKFLTEFAGAVATLLMALPEAGRRAAADEITKRSAPFKVNGGYNLPGSCNCVAAYK